MTLVNKEKLQKLEEEAQQIRCLVIESLQSAGSGHTAGPLGMADIITAFYFHLLRHDPKNPEWPDRDRLVLSNGHICPALYAAMARTGYFSQDKLKTLRKFGSPLQGHPHREWLPGLETSSGPLGSGLSQAVGMALADRINEEQQEKFFYCLLSDGELNAGNTWEAAMLAAKERLYNLIAVVDRNSIQIDGYTEEIMPLEPLRDKWRNWNWHTLEVDGHNFEEFIKAVEQGQAVFNKPTVILAHTIPGRGVSEFERQYEWHGRTPDRKQVRQALKELRTLGGKIEE